MAQVEDEDGVRLHGQARGADERHEIIYDIPAVTMRRKDMVLKIPEFGSSGTKSS
jgi:hypothetical protein